MLFQRIYMSATSAKHRLQTGKGKRFLVDEKLSFSPERNKFPVNLVATRTSLHYSRGKIRNAYPMNNAPVPAGQNPTATYFQLIWQFEVVFK